MLLVAVVALVAVMTRLGMTGKFVQGNISTSLTTPIPTMLWTTMIPTLRMTFRPSLRPSLRPPKCLTSMPLIQLAADYVRDGDQFGIILSVVVVGLLLELLILTI